MVGRPYLLWDDDRSDEQVRAILHGENEVERVWLMTRILECARGEDIWRYLTPEDIPRDLPRLRFRRPQDKELWAYALARWGYGEHFCRRAASGAAAGASAGDARAGLFGGKASVFGQCSQSFPGPGESGARDIIWAGGENARRRCFGR